VYRPNRYELALWILALGLVCLFVMALDLRKRFALDGLSLYHRSGHSKTEINLAQVKSATFNEHECLEITLDSGATHQISFLTIFNSMLREKLRFIDAIEEKLPVPLTKWAFYEKHVLTSNGKLDSPILQKWHAKMKATVSEEVARFPIKETWGATLTRKATPPAVALIVLSFVLLPILSYNRAPDFTYSSLLIPLGIATWLVVRKKVPTLDLVIGQDGLGVALGETFIFGEPYRQIKAFTFEVSDSHAKKSSYWFQIETAHGTKITEEILVESPSSTKDLFFVKGQLPLREETAEADPRSAPKPWEPYLLAPNNTPRTK